MLLREGHSHLFLCRAAAELWNPAQLATTVGSSRTVLGLCTFPRPRFGVPHSLSTFLGGGSSCAPQGGQRGEDAPGRPPSPQECAVLPQECPSSPQGSHSLSGCLPEPSLHHKGAGPDFQSRLVTSESSTNYPGWKDGFICISSQTKSGNPSRGAEIINCHPLAGRL